ncbi:MAG: helix-turn-helix transcriptional regulator [Geobacter sp.]|nr:MAG: helix-turn-helix transcriptional regulator [Geobacter sp.]
MLTATSKKIKKLMLDADVSQSDIALLAEVSRSAINHIIAGRGKSPRLRLFIAKTLGVPVGDLWPEESPSSHARRPKCTGHRH